MTELYIPKTGDIFSFSWKRGGLKSISFGRVFRYSTFSGLWLRRPRIERPMTALKRFFELVQLDQVEGLTCEKCKMYPIEFHTSIRAGNELDYSGFESIRDTIFGRKFGK